VLDRSVRATQLRYPVVGDLARSARFRWFDAPGVEAARQRTRAAVEHELAHLRADPDAPDRDHRMQTLVSAAEPIVRFLGEATTFGSAAVAPLLEALARRQYHPHTALENLTWHHEGAHVLLSADYTLDSWPSRLVSTAPRTPTCRARPPRSSGWWPPVGPGSRWSTCTWCGTTRPPAPERARRPWPPDWTSTTSRTAADAPPSC
jgi:hypothetical protein